MAKKKLASLEITYRVTQGGVQILLPCINPKSITMAQILELSKIVPHDRSPKHQAIQTVLECNIMIMDGLIVCASPQVVQAALRMGAIFLPKRQLISV